MLQRLARGKNTIDDATVWNNAFSTLQSLKAWLKAQAHSFSAAALAWQNGYFECRAALPAVLSHGLERQGLGWVTLRHCPQCRPAPGAAPSVPPFSNA